MPRFSVYVPDSLLDEVGKRFPGGNRSQLVAEGLRRLLNPDREPAFAIEKPQVEEAVMDPILERLSGGARRDFRAGYETGIKLLQPHRNSESPLIEWHELDLLHAFNWDLSKWLQQLGKQYATDDLDDALGYLGPDEDMPTSAFEAGVVSALREAWTAVVKGVEVAEV